MEKEKAKDRIRKLLAIANNTPSAEEAATAAAQAQRLMEKFRVDNIAYTTKGEQNLEGITRHPALYTSGRIALWRQLLAQAIAEANYCTIYLHYSGKRQNSIMLIGRESDASGVRYLFEYCSREIEQLCKKYLTTKSLNKSQGRIAGNNFKLGAVDTISDRLKKASKEALKKAEKEFDRRQDEGKSTAIAKFSDALTQLKKRKEEVAEWMADNIELTKGAKTNYYDNPDAYNEGKKAGRRIDIDSNKKALK